MPSVNILGFPGDSVVKDMRVGPLRKLSAEEMMLSNSGAGEDS